MVLRTGSECIELGLRITTASEESVYSPLTSKYRLPYIETSDFSTTIDHELGKVYSLWTAPSHRRNRITWWRSMAERDVLVAPLRHDMVPRTLLYVRSSVGFTDVGRNSIQRWRRLLLLRHSLLHCALAAAQCIVIGPVCLWVGGSVTTITRNFVHRSSPNWVCR